MPRHQRRALASGDFMHIAFGHTAVPHLDRTPLGAQAQQGGATEHVHRQDALELGVHLPQGLRKAVALGGHAVEHFGQRHGANGGRQAMAGEIAEQHVHVTGRRVGRQQQITVEQGIGRLQVADIGCGIDTAGVGNLVEHRLGCPLLMHQVLVVPGDQVALLQDRGLQAAQAIHGVDLRCQYQGL